MNFKLGTFKYEPSVSLSIVGFIIFNYKEKTIIALMSKFVSFPELDISASENQAVTYLPLEIFYVF